MDILQLIANGIPAGVMYSLVALCIVLIHNGTNVVHFGYGDQITFAAYLVVIAQTFMGAPLWVAILCSIVFSALFGLFIYLAILAPIRRTPLLVQVIATLAIGTALREGMRAFMGPDPWPFPNLVAPKVFNLDGIFVTSANIAAVVIAVVITVALFVFFKVSKYGQAIIAACENARGASIVGISVTKVFAGIWIVASVIAAISAILMAPVVTLSPDMGLIGIKGFCAAILGGFTSLPGAIVGGILLGLIETAAGFYISTAAKDVVAYGVLIAVVIFRPQGLFGKAQLKKV
ncbi:branched-chain amino acid ABC transporter permease [Tardiphaga sp.]|jgi:branched-chain amino acid transport system permease protein|uniref:branched-chain amino acid ABC transporter permease n=1 Tax=Tardiphaga sp. TaxID=1926292 RepID=UPI0037D99E5A